MMDPDQLRILVNASEQQAEAPEALEDVDHADRQPRTSHTGLAGADRGVAVTGARVMEIIDEHTAQLGFTAGIRFAGPLDPGPDEELAHDILAVTRDGGTFQLTIPATGGTHLAWTARLHPSGQARKAGPKVPDTGQ